MSSSRPLPALVEACRPLQGAKNLLVFVPLLAAHGPFTPEALRAAIGLFLAFTAVSSAVYLVNDSLDLEADRSHPTKRERPLASGRTTRRAALLLALVLLVAAVVVLVSFDVPGRAGVVLAIYFWLALLYSTLLKRLLLLDVLALSILSMARILAGGAATETPISPWLMAFSGFLFLSLAFLKRFGELRVRGVKGDEVLPRRAYRGHDLPLIRTAGLTSGYVATLVLALYVNGAQASTLYARPELLWLACPALLYWITRMWILANRGGRDDDPVVLALRDPASYAAGVWVLAVAVAATG